MTECKFIAVPDPAWTQFPPQYAPAIGWCETHNRKADECHGAHTMNIDAKAREIVFDNFPTLKDCGLVQVISAALLAVRNEALEEAAKAADEEDGYPEGTGSHATDFVNQGRNETAREIATAIRALKGDTAT